MCDVTGVNRVYCIVGLHKDDECQVCFACEHLNEAKVGKYMDVIGKLCCLLPDCVPRTDSVTFMPSTFFLKAFW